MRPLRCLAIGALVLLGLARYSSAESPLRLLSPKVDAVVSVPDSKRAIDLIRNLDALEKVSTLALVQEQLHSTSARRLQQFLAYYEKTLGDKWPALLEKLTAGGVGLGVKVSQPNAHAVLVVQAADEALMSNFVETMAKLVESELARQESKEKLRKGEYQGIPGYRLGDLWVARAGATLVLSNKKEAMQEALDRYLGKVTGSILDAPTFQQAGKLFPKDALATGWFNMKPVHESPAGKELYRSPRDNSQLTVLFGKYFDVLGRSPFFCGAITGEKNVVRLSLRFPSGRDGMGVDRLLHVPPEGQPGCLPLLLPKGVIYSSSFYLDVRSIWKDRTKLFNQVQAEGLTNFDKTSGRVLGGIKLSTLLESAGARHRFLAVSPTKLEYKREPMVRLPAFAFVSQVREPERLGRAMETLLRTAGLLATNTFHLELNEERHRDLDVIGYRFKENVQVSQDVNDVRYNFTPCFTRVGDQFVLCSNVDLCKQLIDVLKDEATKSIELPTQPMGRDRLTSRGVASYLGVIEDQLVTQTILDQAIPPGDAKQRVEELLGFLRDLGTLSTAINVSAKRSSFNVTLRLKK